MVNSEKISEILRFLSGMHIGINLQYTVDKCFCPVLFIPIIQGPDQVLIRSPYDEVFADSFITGSDLNSVCLMYSILIQSGALKYPLSALLYHYPAKLHLSLINPGISEYSTELSQYLFHVYSHEFRSDWFIALKISPKN